MTQREELKVEGEVSRPVPEPSLEATSAPRTSGLKVEVPDANRGDWITLDGKSQMTFLHPEVEREKREGEYVAALGHIFLTTEELTITLPEKVVLSFKSEGGEVRKETSYGIDYWVDGEQIVEKGEVKIPQGVTLFFADNGKRVHPVTVSANPPVNLLKFV